MSEVLTGLGTVAVVLGVWTLGALVALMPVVTWFRMQALANEVRSRQVRRQAWLSASRSADQG